MRWQACGAVAVIAMTGCGGATPDANEAQPERANQVAEAEAEGKRQIAEAEADLAAAEKEAPVLAAEAAAAEAEPVQLSAEWARRWSGCGFPGAAFAL